MLSIPRIFPFRGLLFFTIGVVPSFVFPTITQAQLVRDNTLGAESSVVTPQNLRTLIEGGAVRGDNLDVLFHSFTEFNVNLGEQVYFANPDGIVNIFTRVTGFNPSNINGVLGVDGGANLFLLNPNGISFGENASLDMSGSFFATTAESFVFGNEAEFSGTNPHEAPLLTINITPGLQYGENPGDITVNQSNLTVNQGQNLSLVGGNVSVTGSGDIANLQGSLTASGGRIELGGLTAAGTVNINPDLSLIFPDGVARGDVSLTNAATLSVVSDTIGFNGGNVALTGENLFITSDGAILAGIGAGFGGEGVTAGDINLNATGSVTISDSFNEATLPAGLLTQGRGVQNRLNERATGTGGNVNVTADSLSITNGGFISVSTFGFGNSGNINVNVAGALAIDGENETSFSRLSNVVTDTAVGDSGDIIINADSVFLTNAGTINTQVFSATLDEDGVQQTPGGVGNAGDIQITTNTFTMNSEADINTITSGVGNAGNVLINATGNVTIDGAIGERFFTQIVSNVSAGARGDAGDITINAASFSLLNSATLATLVFGTTEDGTPGGIGNAGNILINVTGDVNISGTNVNISGTDANGILSEISNEVRSGAIGNSGNITIIGNSIFISDLFLDSRNFSSGNAGNIALNASEIVSITGQSRIRTGGKLGNISIGNPLDGDTTFTPTEVIIDSSFISSSNSIVTASEFENVEIDTGNISIYALESIYFSNTQDVLSAIGTNTTRLGDAGNVTLNTLDSGQINFDDFVIQTVIGGVPFKNGTRIIQGTGNAGRLEIITGLLNVTNNSFIDSSTSGIGNSGLITITAADSVSITGVPGGDSSDITNFVSTASVGNGNDIIINTPSLFLSNGDISTATIGQGNAGNIQINAFDSVTLTNGSSVVTNTFSQGNAGNINIEAGDGVVSLNDSSLATAVSSVTIQGEDLVGNGNAGDININARSISLTNGAQLISSSGGRGNTVFLDSIDSKEFSIRISTAIEKTQPRITTDRSIIADGSESNDSESFFPNDSLTITGQENAGDIKLNVTDTVLIDGVSTNNRPSGIFSEAGSNSTSNAGSITIDSEQVTISNGGIISVSSSGTGIAGDLTVISDNLTLDNGSITAQTANTDGGNIANNLFLNDSQITALTGLNTQAGGANITLDIADLLRIENESSISATALEDANGGNITINGGFLVAFPSTRENGSDIAANAFRGDGGRVNITADGIFGIQFRDNPTPDNDITVTSTQGSDGIVQLNTPDTNPAAGLNNLPSAPANPQPIRRCQTITDEGDSTFVDKGRGGLPPNPYEALSNGDIWEDVETPTQLTENPRQIIEAQGWIINERGNVELVADVAAARARMGCDTSS